MKKASMLAIDSILAVILLVLDQFTKHLAIAKLQNKAAYVLIDGVLELQYLENRGSAFGILQGRRVLLLILGVLFIAILVFLLVRIPVTSKYRILHILTVAVVAGGIGNMADRFRLGYVVDFIYFCLIDYPIFNVADVYVVIGTIGLGVLFLFVYQDEDLAFLDLKRKRCEETE